MKRRLEEEQGFALVAVVLVGLVLFGLTVVTVSAVGGEITRSAKTVSRTAAFEAAEAGVDDYVAKLTEDHLYYAHWVHPAESTRRTPTGTLVVAGSAWVADLTWTYPTAHNRWRPLGNGYEFNLQVTPPTTASPAVRIVATGRKTGTNTGLRTVELHVRPASVADFQMVANRDISYGASATTRGKLYAGIDETGTAHNISHYGTAYGDLYAENLVARAPTYQDGARGYDRNTIRTKIRNPVNFNTFTKSLVDIQRSAATSGITLNDTATHGWRLTFVNDGTVTIDKCKRVGSAHLAKTSPTCTVYQTKPVPAIGAIYSAQSVLVRGVVKGRVTVASNVDVVVAGATSYLRPGTDVLGLIAKNEMIVPQWAPTNLSWTAATIAQTGQWRSWDNDGSHGTMTFTGSTAAALGGYMDMFDTRVYNYDPNLLYLQPPYFPVLEEAYTVVFFRELPPGGQ